VQVDKKDEELLAVLQDCLPQFCKYLGADSLKLGEKPKRDSAIFPRQAQRNFIRPLCNHRPPNGKEEQNHVAAWPCEAARGRGHACGPRHLRQEMKSGDAHRWRYGRPPRSPS
jgi:hypothetical protein